MKSETNLASKGAEGFGGEQAGFAGIHECGFSGVGDAVAEESADGWEPLEIVRGMEAQFTLRSVAFTLKVADLIAV